MEQDMLFAAQSAALRPWAATIGRDALAQPSVLDGWTVADLLAHLAMVHDAVAALRPAPERAEPMTTADYLRQYGPDADRIAGVARSIAVENRADVLVAWDKSAHQAAQTLGALGVGDRVVQTRRGPILQSSFLDTRLIELVVHADDLARSLPDHPAPPVLPSARRRVVLTLREVLTSRADDAVGALAAASAMDPDDFVAVATGRVDPDPDLPAALATLLPLF
jgi:uncharacterized protein (TIGR03083 family)